MKQKVYLVCTDTNPLRIRDNIKFISISEKERDIWFEKNGWWYNKEEIYISIEDEIQDLLPKLNVFERFCIKEIK